MVAAGGINLLVEGRQPPSVLTPHPDPLPFEGRGNISRSHGLCGTANAVGACVWTELGRSVRKQDLDG